MRIKIGNKEYSVKIAETDEEHEIGLQNVEKLPENEGMLFLYEEPTELSFWMEDTNLNLDIIFINEDFEVISVAVGKPNSLDTHSEKDVKFVLEVNADSGIKTGDELEFLDDEESKSKMLILNEEGDVQMTIAGGERIFSRKNTKTLLKMAKRAYNSKKDSDYKSLGNKLFKFLEVQDNNDPQYVKNV